MEYDPQNLSIIVNNVYLTGLAETAASIEKSEDNWTVKVGAQGDNLRTRVRNTLGTITVTLLANSPQVPMLDELANSGAKVPISVIYKGDFDETVTSEEAFVMKPANREYGNEIADREYTFQLLDMLVA